MLSVIAHGRGRKALAVGHSALYAASGLDDRRARLYADLIFSELSAAARQALERMMMDKPYEYQSEFAKRYFGQGLEKGREEGIEEGIEKGERGMLLRLLEKRFGDVPEGARQRVNAATGAEVAAWAERLLIADSIEAVFAAG